MRNDTVTHQNHWSERGRATSVSNADAPRRQRRSVLAPECVGAAELGFDMRKKEILIGGVLLAAGTVGVALLQIGGGASKWGQVILAVGIIVGGLLQ